MHSQRAGFSVSGNFDKTETERLLALARQNDGPHRLTLFMSVVHLFEMTDDRLSGGERALVASILRQLSHEVEMSIRQRLAERLAQSTQAPRELLMLLADDVIEVAYPILVGSTLLNEPDLLEIIQSRSNQHRMAIALRQDISPGLADALIAAGDDAVIVTLLNNFSGPLSRTSLEHLVSRSENVEGLCEPLLRRTDLPPDLAQLMFGWVSEALRSYILENFEIAPSTLRNALVPARDEAISEALEMIDPAQRLVDKLHAAGDLRPTFLLKHLTRGDVILFEFTFAKLSDLSPVFIRRIIYESTGEGLALACAALGIDRSVFATMFRLTRRARREPEVLTPEKILRVKHIFETMDRSGAHSALRIWARERGYFTASTGQAPN